MTEPEKKMFIFQQSNKKSVKFNGKEWLFYETLKKEQKSWKFSIFFNLQKKSLTIIVKYLRAFSL